MVATIRLVAALILAWGLASAAAAPLNNLAEQIARVNR